MAVQRSVGLRYSVTHLLCAGDIVLFTLARPYMLWVARGSEAALAVKTLVGGCSDDADLRPVKVGEVVIPRVVAKEGFLVWGSQISSGASLDAEIDRRIEVAWRACWCNRSLLLCRRLDAIHRLRLLGSAVQHV